MFSLHVNMSYGNCNSVCHSVFVLASFMPYFASSVFYLSGTFLPNQATGYASQHKSVPVPSQDKLGGLRFRKGIWRNMGDGGTVSFGWSGVHQDCRCLCLRYLPWGGYGGGCAVSSDGMAPTRTVGSSASIIFPCSTKI